jgi:hypothetical protein
MEITQRFNHARECEHRRGRERRETGIIKKERGGDKREETILGKSSKDVGSHGNKDGSFRQK